MGVFDDVGRLWDVSKKQQRPGFVQGIKQAADAAEAAQEMKEQMAANGGAPQGLNGDSFNPFDNIAGMTTMTRGSGTITKFVDTGETLDDAHVYNVTFDVTADGHPGFSVVHKQVVSAGALGNWQVGKVMPVRFDPANLTQITIG